MDIAPFHDDVAYGPDGGAAHWVTTVDGLKIRVGHWTCADVKGTVLIFPGRTEYVEKYGDAAREFLEANYATVSIDWR
ncbi:MAG: alpha/beta hydrolase, partial [Yoonia sp.]